MAGTLFADLDVIVVDVRVREEAHEKEAVLEPLSCACAEMRAHRVGLQCIVLISWCITLAQINLIVTASPTRATRPSTKVGSLVTTLIAHFSPPSTY